MIDLLENICLKLKGTTQDIKWENLCFLVGNKIYCMAALERSSVCFKVPKDEFDELTARPGIEQAPHMARNQWVVVRESAALTVSEWKHYIRQSYQLIFAKLTKKLQQEILGAQSDFS